MPRALEDILLGGGLVTPAQLEEAGATVSSAPGGLGARLVELGWLTEDALCSALSQACGVPAVAPNQLLGAAPEVVALLPAEFAVRRVALPFAVEGERLLLALADPADRAALREAEFLTGFVVTPCVAPRSALALAIEAHHCWSGALGAAATGPPLGAATVRTSLAAVARRLADAADRDAVLATVAEELARWLGRGLVFALRGEAAALVRTHGVPHPAGPLVTIGAAERSVLSPALAGRAHYGPVETTAANQALFARLGGAPEAALVAPVLVRERPLLVLYADDPTGSATPPDLRDAERLAAQTACALEIAILRNKLLALSGPP